MKTIFKPSLSTILVTFFFFILLFLGLFAEVFESQTPEVDMAQIYANPAPLAELQRLKTLRLTNKQGNFLLENTNPEGLLDGPWQMVEPQSLRLKSDVVTKILEALNMIRVRNFHRLEPINVSSYSLDNPTLTLLFNNDKNKSVEIKMGLINPIDNSAYISLSTQDQIYQIDPLNMALESYDLAQLVESKVLALNIDALLSLEIYTEQGLETKLLKKGEDWVDQLGVVQNADKVAKFFERLDDLKSVKILENLTPEQKEAMDKTVATPLYSMKMISSVGVRSYFVGELKNPILGLDLNLPVLVLTSEDKKSFVTIERDALKTFKY